MLIDLPHCGYPKDEIYYLSNPVMRTILAYRYRRTTAGFKPFRDSRLNFLKGSVIIYIPNSTHLGAYKARFTKAVILQVVPKLLESLPKPNIP